MARNPHSENYDTSDAVQVEAEPVAKRSTVEAKQAAEQPRAPAAAAQPFLAWAKAKGMANRFIETSGVFVQANPLYQDFAQARAFAGWADDAQITEADFDAAVIAAKAHVFR
jgi:hypothetical protein